MTIIYYHTVIVIIAVILYPFGYGMCNTWSDCPEEWHLHQDRCYKLFKLKKTWLEAQQHCETYKGYLATVSSQDTEGFVINKISPENDFFLGLKKLENEDGQEVGWFWRDGSIEERNRWYPGKPNDRGSEKDYVAARLKDKRLQWIDLPPSDEKEFLCSKRRTIASACPDGWKRHEEKCYLVDEDQRSWESSRLFCENEHGRLVKIPSKEVADFLIKEVNQSTWYWIGLKNDGTDVWKWRDGSVLKNYKSWEREQPSGQQSGIENCVAANVASTQQLKWHDDQCRKKRGFICYKDISNFELKNDCPVGWKSYNGHCYSRVVDKKSWNEAQDRCSADGGNLATISSPDVEGFLTSAFPLDDQYWVGLRRDEDSRMEWLWGDGSTYDNYIPWKAGEITIRDICARVKKEEDSLTLWDKPCTNKFAFLCSKSIGYRNECTDGWTLFSGVCYMLMEDKKSWHDATHYCEKEAGVLAIISSPEVNDFLSKEIQLDQDFWIALRRDMDSGAWLWSNGSLHNEDVISWGREEPNEATGEEDECARVERNKNNRNLSLLDAPCDKGYGFLCSKTIVIETMECPDGWELYKGRCYVLVNERMAWVQAQSYCEERVGNLVSISSLDVQDFIVQKFHRSGGIWIGLKKSEKRWAWSDRLPLQYTSWGYGEPSNGTLELCGEMLVAGASKERVTWNDVSCTKEQSFICSKLAVSMNGCPAGWKFFEGQCYFLNKDKDTWLASQEHCKGVGGQLADIATLQVEEFLGREFDYSDFYWTGLRKHSDETWVWGDGRAFGSFQRWAPTEPNGAANGIEVENCGVAKEFQSLQTIFFFSAPCENNTFRIAFLCSKKRDVDECNENPSCQINSRCVNKVGSYTCLCNEGYIISIDGTACNDINECSTNSHSCDANSDCRNTEGTYSCVCDDGYSGDGFYCDDVNECNENPSCQINSRCVNEVGSYTCLCNEGYIISLDGTACNDINECSTNSHSCDANSDCRNTEGTYSCVCDDGYSGDGFYCDDVNECKEKTSCQINSRCVNEVGSYTCLCNEGYIISVDGTACNDIDECSTNSHSCNANSDCRNTEGNYSCICDDGYSGDGYYCDDVDECKEKTSCQINSRCVNEVGSYTCLCNEGYIISVDETACNDIDECSTNSHSCDANSDCRNTEGTYSCVCDNGYSGDGFYCDDVDECNENPSCQINSRCVNEVGSYTCLCNEGYIISVDETACNDIDECSTNSHSCDANSDCRNTEGTYSCVCDDGYSGDGFYCDDVDECNENPSCQINSRCVNEVGSYTCLCNEGYIISVDETACNDIDECSTNSHSCDANSDCRNTEGTYSCVCDDGYSGDGFYCDDVDECNENPSCQINSRCVNEVGSYTCLCNEGYIISVDGTACNDLCKIDLMYCDTEGLENQKNEIFESFNDTINDIIANAKNGTPVDIDTAVGIVTTFNDIVALDRVEEEDYERILSALNRLNGLVEKRTLVPTPAFTAPVAFLLSNVTSSLLGSNSSYNATDVIDRKEQVIKDLTNLGRFIDLEDEDSFDLETEYFSIKSQRHDGDKEFSADFGETVRVQLPEGTFGNSSRRERRELEEITISLIWFEEPELFPISDGISQVVSVDIQGFEEEEDLDEPIIIEHLDTNTQHGRNANKNDPSQVTLTRQDCVFWDFHKHDWSNEGCCLDSDSSPPQCKCNHMTNFALIVTNSSQTDVILGIVSDVGCYLSILGFVLTFIVHLCVKELRNRRQTAILLNMCFNFTIAYVIFVAGVSRAYSEIACDAVAVFLHYFLLASWFWMTSYSFDVYLTVAQENREFGDRYVQKLASFSYLTPAVIVGLTAIITLLVTDAQAETPLCGAVQDPLAPSSYRSSDSCWLHGYPLYFTFLLPIGIMLLFNIFVFIRVIMEMTCKKREKSADKGAVIKHSLGVLTTMVFTVGIAWAAGFLLLISEDPTYVTVVSWIFAVFVAFQGFFLFLLTVIRRKQLRNVLVVPPVRSKSDEKRISKRSESWSTKKVDVEDI